MFPLFIPDFNKDYSFQMDVNDVEVTEQWIEDCLDRYNISVDNIKSMLKSVKNNEIIFISYSSMSSIPRMNQLLYSEGYSADTANFILAIKECCVCEYVLTTSGEYGFQNIISFLPETISYLKRMVKKKKINPFIKPQSNNLSQSES